jgi:SAM-dependent methyltransferase
MPVSFLDVAPRVIEEIRELQPASILDVGCGYGTYGHLIRAHVDKWPWKIRLEAVEGFDKYLYRIGNTAYNRVYPLTWESFNAHHAPHRQYDLILLIDVIEHFDKEEGLEVLEQCKAISERVLFSTPADPAEQGAEYGNKLEIHKSRWTWEDFASFRPRVLLDNHARVGVIE